MASGALSMVHLSVLAPVAARSQSNVWTGWSLNRAQTNVDLLSRATCLIAQHLWKSLSGNIFCPSGSRERLGTFFVGQWAVNDPKNLSLYLRSHGSGRNRLHDSYGTQQRNIHCAMSEWQFSVYSKDKRWKMCTGIMRCLKYFLLFQDHPKICRVFLF